jgi:hypothetical protein
MTVDTRQATILAAAIQLLEALDFYANPDTYHAILAIGDPPCGDFIRDVAPLKEDDPYEDYRRDNGDYYGKRAREALMAWRVASSSE